MRGKAHEGEQHTPPPKRRGLSLLTDKEVRRNEGECCMLMQPCRAGRRHMITEIVQLRLHTSFFLLLNHRCTLRHGSERSDAPCALLHAKPSHSTELHLYNRSMDFSRVAERLLAEAREHGVFDNLPRRGRLNLEDDDLVPEEDRLAVRVLKQNEMLPEWIETDKSIREQISTARTALAHAYQRYRQAMTNARSPQERHRAEEIWQQARKQFEDTVAQINQAIFEYNLRAPSALVQRLPLRLAEEYARLENGPAP